MSSEQQSVHGDSIEQKRKPMEAQSAFASTLLTDAEKVYPSQVAGQTQRPGNLYGARVDTTAIEAGLDAAYTQKAQILNEAMLDIGMGMYQWILFGMTAVAWFLDTFWISAFIIVMPAAANEAQFFFTGQNSTDLMISLYVGLSLGALGWPILSDRIGRKDVLTSTLVLMGMSGLVGAGMTAFTGLCVVGFIVGFAVGGNQSVNAIVLLESLPASHQWLVSLQGAFWGLGELVGYAVGWAFIELYTCHTGPDAEATSSQSFSRRQSSSGSSSSATGSSSGSSSSSSSSSASSCHYVSNKGWRYTWWCFGCITLFLYLIRFFFVLHETPKSLLARRRDAEAVQTVKDIAAYNKRSTWLTESNFARVDTAVANEEGEPVRRSFGRQSVGSSIRGVFAAVNPFGLIMLILLWSVIGLTFILQQQFAPTYLATKGVSAVTATSVTTPYLFSRYVYVSICAIPGPLVATFLVESKVLGRKRAGAIFSLLSGVFMLAQVASSSRGAALGFQCILSFLQYASLAIITTYTVEVFGAPVRGTGVGLTSFFWRFFGLVAWIVAAYGSSSSGAAVFFSGAISIIMAGVWFVLPRETLATAAA